MIVGIGTDIVEVKRFSSWLDYSQERLEKVFTPQELHDCFGEESAQLTAETIRASEEKLAVRFAAKEAFYKALSAALVSMNLAQNEFSFLSTCRYVSVVSGTWGVPLLLVDWDFFANKVAKPLPLLQAHLSLSHEKTMALAFVVLSK